MKAKPPTNIAPLTFGVMFGVAKEYVEPFPVACAAWALIGATASTPLKLAMPPATYSNVPLEKVQV